MAKNLTKIRVKPGKKVIYGCWHFGGEEIMVDLELDSIKNQRNYYDIVDLNYQSKPKPDRPELVKEMNSENIRNRMMSKRYSK